jgi:hypothetical protein
MTKKDETAFDLSTLEPETGISVTPRSNEFVIELYNKLDQLEVGQSYKMPMDIFRVFVNAKTNLKRVTKKIIITRKIDKYNFRCWRLADETKLSTRRAPIKTKKKK